VETVYFGGGTPSLLTPGQIAAILDAAAQSCGITGDAEITIEHNPGVKTDFRALRSAGANRLSVGVQSSVGGELVALGRLHTPEDAKTAVLSAHDAGFDNISVDLMLGIPGQTPETLTRSIDYLTGLPVTHISAYMLKVEENTPFHGSGVEPDEDLCADLYLQMVRELTQRGFPQYEISNFAMPGKESKHNLNYWKLGDYLGLGPSAHSLLGGERFSFSRDLSAFLAGPLSQLIEEGPGNNAGEFIMLSLRLSEGLDLPTLESRYSLSRGPILERAAPYIKANLAKLENGRLSLTPEGFLLSNTIIAELI